MGCHALLQGIFPIQGSNPGLLHCRWILYCLSHQGRPIYFLPLQKSLFWTFHINEIIQYVTFCDWLLLFFFGELRNWQYLHLVAQMVKNLPAMQDTWVRSLGWEDPLEKGMATHFSILAWRIPMHREAWRATAHGITESWT